jgi:putative ABC transport system permease protein
MNRTTLVVRSATFAWRSAVGVVLGVAVTAAVLVGALAVGDSVRATLAGRVAARIGEVDVALEAGDRFVTDGIALRMAARLEADGRGGQDGVRGAGVLRLPGFVARAGGAAGAGSAIVSCLGVDEAFFRLAPGGGASERGEAIGPGEAWIGRRVAERLGLAPNGLPSQGIELLLRVERPSPLPRDAVVASIDDVSLGLRVAVARIVDDAAFASFDLAARGEPAQNVFVDRGWLQREVGLEGRANLLLFGGGADGSGGDSDGPGLDPADVDAAFARSWTLADAQLEITEARGGAGSAPRRELRTDRIFLDDAVVEAVSGIAATAPAESGGGLDATRILTWFVNALVARPGSDDERATPYSMVTAVGPLAPGSGGEVSALVEATTAGLGDDRIVPIAWLVDDLRLQPRDAVRLDYYVLGRGNRLEQRSRTFEVAERTADDDGPAVDPTLMPPFPGLSDSENCRDWEPGLPVDLGRIRDVDEAYWDRYRGAPKAFVTLAAGDAMWRSALGSTTAIRGSEALLERVAERLPRRLDPRDLGLFCRDVRGPAEASGGPATDFGGLFLGLSMFLIAAALVLTALLFAFRVEERGPQIGVLLTVGFTPRLVARLLLVEALVLAALGALLGVPLGLGYTLAVLTALHGAWSGALGETAEVVFAPTAVSLVGGAVAAVVVAGLSVLGAVRRPTRRGVDLVALLRGEALAASGRTEHEVGERPGPPSPARGGGSDRSRASRVPRYALVLLALGVIGAPAIVFAVPRAGSGANAQALAGAFFGAGALVLLGFVGAARLLLARFAYADARLRSITGLALRNAARRPGRSVATIAMLAAGVFLVASVRAFRLDAPGDPGVRASGTGGFRLLVRTVLPILRDLSTDEGRSAYALDDLPQDVEIVPLHVVAGDEASCLNLGSPRTPRLLGVDPEVLARRGSFVFAGAVDGGEELSRGAGERPSSSTLSPSTLSPWTLLEADLGPDVVPAIGDAASLQWTLHKAVGDEIEYVDDRGRPFSVRIVGALQDSLVQGSLVVADRVVAERFGASSTGTREFWVDVPGERADAVAAELRRMLGDFGAEVTRSADRLSALHAVQNTYLVIFQALGGLGVLLGTVGLGLVVLRNVLERRAELAVLEAVGFTPAAVRRLLLVEHALLLVLGLVGGCLAAALAILPGVLARGGIGDAYGSVALLALVLGLAGLAAVALAARVVRARGGDLVTALRAE